MTREMMMTLWNRFSFMFKRWSASKDQRKREQEITDRAKRGAEAAMRRLEIEGDWIRWIDTSPPRDELVEVMIGTTGNSYELVPSEMNPYANIYNLYWRPTRSMRVVNAGHVESRYFH